MARAETLEHRHLVQFYEDPDHLAEQVAAYLQQALAAGGGAVVIARASLLKSVERELGDRIAVDALKLAGRLSLLDADHVLSLLLIEKSISRSQFRHHVAGLIARMRATVGTAPIHAYGEMVDVLWTRQQRAAVFELETLWSELMRADPMKLVCGYQLRSFGADTQGFSDVCAAHDHVGPAHEHDLVAQRVLAQVEQRARVLEIEVIRRTKLERRMLELVELSGQLAAASDANQIAELALAGGLKATGAFTGALYRVASGGTHLQLLAESHQGFASDRYRVLAMAGDTPLAQVIRTGEPVFLGHLDEYAERFPTSVAVLDELRASGQKAFAVLPIALDNRVLGGIAFTFDHEREFLEPDRAFKAIIARQCALAFARVEQQEKERTLREAAERAAQEADEATRAREEILSVVSHDLRNPLGTILMGATSLLNVDAGDKGQRIRTTAERIHRQAERMARLIEDLVDFAGIQAGKLALERKQHRPEEILSATSDIFTPLALERGLKFETRLVPGMPQIECDSDRAVQVMSNLVANALKVTPKGGEISIGAEPREDDVVFFVRDTGPGIEPDELPRLFERYWRSKHSQYKGAGLGLSIARGIVDAHGGKIWAESRAGAGSTFYFSLASLRGN